MIAWIFVRSVGTMSMPSCRESPPPVKVFFKSDRFPYPLVITWSSIGQDSLSMARIGDGTSTVRKMMTGGNGTNLVSGVQDMNRNARMANGARIAGVCFMDLTVDRVLQGVKVASVD